MALHKVESETAWYQLHPKYQSMDELMQRHGGSGFSLDLGCGYYKPAGYIGLDNLVGAAAQIPNDEAAPDIYLDLNNQKLPFADGSCERVRASHFFEHCNVDHTIYESFRVLKPGGTLELIIPYANSADGMYPGHLLFFTERWFQESLVFQKHFEIIDLKFKPSDYWDTMPEAMKQIMPFDQARIFMFNVCKEMTLIAKVRKPQGH